MIIILNKIIFNYLFQPIHIFYISLQKYLIILTMARTKTVQGVYEMNPALRKLLKKFMAFNNYDTFPESALQLIQDGLKANKIK